MVIKIVYFKPLLVGVGWKLVKGLLKARKVLKLEIEDDYHSQISVLRMLVEAQMLVCGHQAVSRKFGRGEKIWGRIFFDYRLNKSHDVSRSSEHDRS